MTSLVLHDSHHQTIQTLVSLSRYSHSSQHTTLASGRRLSSIPSICPKHPSTRLLTFFANSVYTPVLFLTTSLRTLSIRNTPALDLKHLIHIKYIRCFFFSLSLSPQLHWGERGRSLVVWLLTEPGGRAYLPLLLVKEEELISDIGPSASVRPYDGPSAHREPSVSAHREP